MKAKTYAVIAASMVCCLLTGCGKTEINVNDYLTVNAEGVDGFGYLTYSLAFGDLVKDNYKAFGLKDNYSQTEYQTIVQKYKDSLLANLETTEGLSNGDKIVVKLDESACTEIESEYDVKFDIQEIEYTVSDLGQATVINPFDYIEVVYSNGFVSIDNSAWQEVPLPSRTPGIRFDILPQNQVGDGDTFKVQVTASGYLTMESLDGMLFDNGLYLSETEREYKVEGDTIKEVES